MPLSYQVTEVGHSFTILDGGKDMMFLATGSSCESSADVELDVDHSAMTPPCRKYTHMISPLTDHRSNGSKIP